MGDKDCHSGYGLPGTQPRSQGVPPVSKFIFQRARAVSVLATTHNANLGNAKLAREQANVNVTFGARGGELRGFGAVSSGTWSDNPRRGCAGSQWRSVEGVFGLFQTTLQCPPSSSDGVITSFFVRRVGVDGACCYSGDVSELTLAHLLLSAGVTRVACNRDRLQI